MQSRHWGCCAAAAHGSAPMMALLLLAAAPAALAAASGSSCTPVSAVALHVSFPCVDATDYYYVAVFADLASATALSPKPLALTTTTGCSAVIEDLKGHTSYYLRVRSHPASAPSTVWSWRNYTGAPLRCTTKAPPALFLSRRGHASLSSVGLQWHTTPQQAELYRAVAVRWQRISHTPGSLAAALQRPPDTLHPSIWRGRSQPLTDGSAVVTNLAPGASYAIVLEVSSQTTWRYVVYGSISDRLLVIQFKGPDNTALSDPVRFRTASIGSSYETVYRVAEETHDVDLLLNHNAGDLKGEAAFLSDSGNYALTPAQIAADPCTQALNTTSCKPGGDCMVSQVVPHQILRILTESSLSSPHPHLILTESCHRPARIACGARAQAPPPMRSERSARTRPCRFRRTTRLQRTSAAMGFRSSIGSTRRLRSTVLSGSRTRRRNRRR